MYTCDIQLGLPSLDLSSFIAGGENLYMLYYLCDFSVL